jgi:hypothetical protein
VQQNAHPDKLSHSGDISRSIISGISDESFCSAATISCAAIDNCGRAGDGSGQPDSNHQE